MSDIAIRVDNLGKLYHIGVLENSYIHTPGFDKSLRESLMEALQSPFRRLGALLGWRNGRVQDAGDTIWALKDVSFEIRRGEVVGIIGHNGAGKSTLLKILSRITEPTSGRVEIRGRVGSLLEVGTGFHPELTGRENIFLNGAILGMKKTEIIRKFDEIVAFSEVEKFIDTPVKRYSSGMYLRLAFAVAAHMDTEILLVDEVLAVGDAAFQKKCLRKMGDVAQEGRTILYVSHNISSINTLCSRVALLENGRVAAFGDTAITTERYLASSNNLIRKRWPDISGQGIRIIKWELVDQSGKETNGAYCGEYFCMQVTIENTGDSSEIALGISVEDLNGTRIFGGLSINDNCTFILHQGESKLTYCLDDLPLNEGLYYMTIAIHKVPSNVMVDRIDQCMSFEVINRKKKTAGRIVTKSNGLIIVHPSWGGQPR